MKKTNIFTLIFFTFIIGAFVSCKDGLTNNIDREKQLVSIQLQLEGQKLKQSGERTIGISSVDEALQGFDFTLNLVNTEDSTKNATVNGDIRTISSYLSSLRLEKGSWKINVSGAKKDVDAAINGSTSFTVGGRDSFYVLNLVISGNAPGSIEFEIMTDNRYEAPLVTLRKLEDYLLNNDMQPQVFSELRDNYTHTNIFTSYGEKMLAEYRIDAIPVGVYYLEVEKDGESFSDVAYIYPGITSKACLKYKLNLDFQYQNQILSVPFTDGYVPLPGYGKNSDRPELVRPGYLFTGWYDTPEAAVLGKSPVVPITQKYIEEEIIKVAVNENTYLFDNRTLYAGWKKSSVSKDLLEQNYFMFETTNNGKVFAYKDSLKNPSGHNSETIKAQICNVDDFTCLVSDNDIYSIKTSDGTLYYCDYAALTESTSSGQINFVWPKESLITVNSNRGKQLFKDKEGQVYMLAYCKPKIDGTELQKIYLAKLNKNEEPLFYAIQTLSDRSEENLFPSDQIEAFAVYNNELFVVYTSDNEPIIAKYSMQPVTADSEEAKTQSKYVLKHEGTDVAITSVYSPYQNAQLYVKEIYIENDTFYFLIDENSYQGYFAGGLVSTGAVLELDSNLNLKGIYGRLPETYYGEYDDPISDNPFITNTVKTSYDITGFAGPKKILAIYDRKMFIYEEGSYPYKKKKKSESEKAVALKKFLGRITIYDLDKKCIDYTQVSDVLMINTSSVNSFSGFEWEQ